MNNQQSALGAAPWLSKLVSFSGMQLVGWLSHRDKQKRR